MPDLETTLVADIGGTNARFAQLDPHGEVVAVKVLAVAEYGGPLEALEAYACETGLGSLGRVAIAAATPIAGDEVRFTNSPWRFSCRELHAALGLTELVVLNDFTAAALALPGLAPAALRAVGSGQADPDAPIGLLGPGTGLGVSALIAHPSGWIPLTTEGGHVTLPATTAEERAVLECVAREHRHVSAERVLSGAGLVSLYRAVCTVRGHPPRALAPAAITAASGNDAEGPAAAAVALFCGFLGVVAGNLALTLGARGGIYVAGGIVPRLGEAFARSPFRARFEAKGRFTEYLQRIPTYVVHEPYLGLRGAAASVSAANLGASIRIR